MKPTVIPHIQRADGRILTQASDSVMVTKVEVMVLDPERAGEIVEQGEGYIGWSRVSCRAGFRRCVSQQISPTLGYGVIKFYQSWRVSKLEN